MASETQDDGARFAHLPEETRKFLDSLSRDDIQTIKNGLPIIRAVIGFGRVTKWLAIAALGFLGGVVMLGESVMKIITWFHPPHP